MRLAELTTSQLRSLLRLAREKEALQGRLAEIEQRIQEIDGSRAPLSSIRKTRRRSRGGSRETAILEALKEADENGLTLRQIAEKTGRTYASIRVWFSTAAKKLPWIRKMAPGHYRYLSGQN